jgi:thermitase
MFARFRILAILGTITLAGCGSLNQAHPLSDNIDSTPQGYLVTLNVTDGSNQASLEQRYSGKALVFDAKSGFAMLHTSKAPANGDPAVKTVEKDSEAVAPEPKPAGEVQLDGTTSWGNGTNSWSSGSTTWGSGWSTWGSGATAWGSGATAWGSGATAWGSGTVVPALPIENQTTWNQIKLYDAHRVSRNFGGGIKVAVIDSGIDLTHPVFAGKLSAISEFWDYVGNDATPQDESGGNGYGHGTAVAGIILQVAPRAKILPIRVLRPDGSANTSDVVAAIGRAVNNGANIINISLGTGGYDQSLMDICTWANNQGVLIVAAAGNNGQLNNLDSPAMFTWSYSTYQMTIGVGSVNANDQKSSFSSYGDSIYTFAPGENIWSAYPGNKSANFTGTSFATPIVTGSIALVMSETSNTLNRTRVLYNPVAPNAFYWNAGQDWPASLILSGYQRGRLNLENFVRSLSGWTAPTDIQAGVYQVVNVNSGKCMDVLGGSTVSNTAVQQTTCGTGNNQKWQIESLGAGLYKLKAMHSGKLLSIGQSDMADKAKTIQWDDGTYIDQKWAIQASGSGYKLVVLHSGKCLDVASSSTADIQLQQNKCSGNSNQQFKLKALF